MVCFLWEQMFAHFNIRNWYDSNALKYSVS